MLIHLKNIHEYISYITMNLIIDFIFVFQMSPENQKTYKLLTMIRIRLILNGKNQKPMVVVQSLSMLLKRKINMEVGIKLVKFLLRKPAVLFQTLLKEKHTSSEFVQSMQLDQVYPLIQHHL